MGGKSSEHSVSLETGASVVCGLDHKKYNIFPVKIELDGTWAILPQHTQSMPRTVYKKLLENNHLESQKLSAAQALAVLEEKNVDFIFIALHGQNGEDGSIQGLCQQLGFAYNGSEIFASTLGIDKLKSSVEFERAELKVPRQIELPKDFSANNKKSVKDLSERVKNWIEYPCFIKPRFGGSSLGTSLANNKKELLQAIQIAKEITDRILIQQQIKGREFTVGVLDINQKLTALPPTEIIPKENFFDFNSKYSPENKAEEITPAKIPPAQVAKLHNTALKAHNAISGSGYSRTDIIVKDEDVEDSYYVLEINTLPGLTKESIFPAQAKAHGIEFSELLDKIIEDGFLRTQNK